MHKKQRWWSRLRPTSRRGKILTALVSFFAAGGIGVALALFIAHAPITGGVSSNVFTPVWTGAATVSDQNDMVCTASITAGTLDIHATNAYPGGSCAIHGALKLPGSGELGDITGVDMQLPPSWTAHLDPTSCGNAIDPADNNGTSVVITLTMGMSAAPGSSSTLQVGDGVAVSPHSEHAPLGPGCT